MEPRELGKYSLHEHMGKGSVANVYRATDNETAAKVALKLFEPDERPPDVMRKLRDREVRMLVSVQHPNIVKFYESGEVDSSFYYTMEFVENSLLTCMREHQEFLLVDKINVLRQCVNALQAIHHQGIVHRDVKPGNILLDEDENGALHVKVTDLGIAKHVSETDVARDNAKRRVPGTPKYLSPEQIQLRPVDGRADIFSLGVVAYDLLSGQPFARGRVSDDFLKANLHVEPRLVHHVNPDLPPFLSQLVAKMLAKDREERYDSDTLGRDLDLTYQHLVSNSPLVEQTDPASIFYVPPAPEITTAPTPTKETVPFFIWLVVAAMLGAGIAIGVLLWPEAPAGVEMLAPVDLAEPLELTDDQTLDLAAKAAGEEQHWQAFSLLRNMDVGELGEGSRRRWQGLSHAVADALAEADYDAAALMLQQDRIEEARIILARMRSYWPGAAAVGKLDRLITGELEAASAQKDRREWFAAVDKRLSGHEFLELIEEAEEYIDAPGLDAASKLKLLDIVRRALNGWGKALLAGATAPVRYRQYMDAIARHRAAGSLDAGDADVTGELRLRLGDFYRANAQNDRAAKEYEHVIANFPGELAQLAGIGMAEIDRAMLRQPLDIASLTRHIATNGFKGDVWREELGQEGRQEVQETGLVIAQTGGAAERMTARETVRPIRNLGFTVSVRFQMKTSAEPVPRRVEVGLEVEDTLRNSVRLSFDGASYNMSRSFRIGGRPVSGGSSVADAAGDEDARWHELALSYNLENTRVIASLDGRKVGEYQGEIGAFRLRVFVQVLGRGECNARFRDVVCRP